MTARRHVRFTTNVGLVSRERPDRFVPPTARAGDRGELLAEPPFSVPDGWVVVRVAVAYDDPLFGPLDELFAPVHPSMIEEER